MLLRCTNTHDPDLFGLNIIMDSKFDESGFIKALINLNTLLDNRKIHAFIFLGDPQIHELGSEVFNIGDIVSVARLLRDYVLTEELSVEVYSSFKNDFNETKEMIKKMNSLEIPWKVSPFHFHQENFKNFLLTLNVCKASGVLGEITCLTRQGWEINDERNYQIIKTLFGETLLSQAPLRGEESSFKNKCNYTTHKLEYTDKDAEALSYYELQGKDISYKGMFCDINNHLELDLSGNLYACSTAYENKDIIDPEEHLEKICSSFKCPYSRCKHNDNMSLSSFEFIS